MFQDAIAILDDKRDVSVAPAFNIGTVASLFSYDCGVAGTPPAGPQGSFGGPLIRDIGRGRKVYLLSQVTTTLVGATATMEVDIIMSASQDLSTPTVLQKSLAIAIATLVAGYRYRLALPHGISQRFLGVQYVIATANITAGAVQSSLIFAEGSDDNADILG